MLQWCLGYGRERVNQVLSIFLTSPPHTNLQPYILVCVSYLENSNLYPVYIQCGGRIDNPFLLVTINVDSQCKTHGLLNKV